MGVSSDVGDHKKVNSEQFYIKLVKCVALMPLCCEEITHYFIVGDHFAVQ